LNSIPLGNYPNQTNRFCPLLPRDTPYQLCSPWSHFGGIYNTNNRVSPFQGPTTGNLKYPVKNFSNEAATTSPIIDSDGTVYFFTIGYNINNNQGCFLHAVKSDGTEKWKPLFFINQANISELVLGKNGILYVPLLQVLQISDSQYDFSTIIYAINTNNGSMQWNNPIIIPNIFVISSPVIGTNGVLYVMGLENFKGSETNDTNTIVYSINTNNGSYQYPKITFPNLFTTVNPVIDSNNILYFTLTKNNGELLFFRKCYLYAIDTKDGTNKWGPLPFDSDYSYNTNNIIMDNEGTLYMTILSLTIKAETVADTYIYAINSKDGSLKWKPKPMSLNGINANSISFQPVIDKNGILYFNYYYNQLINSVYINAIDTRNGNFIWNNDVSFPQNQIIFNSPLIDSSGIMYFITYFFDNDSSSITGKSTITYFNTITKTIQQSKPFSNYSPSQFSAFKTISCSLGADGTLYVLANASPINGDGNTPWNTNLYAINDK